MRRLLEKQKHLELFEVNVEHVYVASPASEREFIADVTRKLQEYQVPFAISFILPSRPNSISIRQPNVTKGKLGLIYYTFKKGRR